MGFVERLHYIYKFRTPRAFSMRRRNTHMGSPLVVWCHGLAA